MPVLAMLTLAGCGSNTSTPQIPTKTTSTGSVTSADGTGTIAAGTVTKAANVPVATGNTLKIQADTIVSSDAGGSSPVAGQIATTVVYSTSAADLPAAAQVLPTGATLAAFFDIDMGAVKYFDKPMQATMNVISGGANVGDTVAIYSFNSVTNKWEPVDNSVVGADGTAAFTIHHLSIWAAFKTATPPPGKPSSSSATAGNAQVTLTWKAPKTGPAPTAYNLYYGTTPGINSAVTSSYQGKVENAVSPQVIKELANGTPYYFIVTAVNGNEESGPSSEETATPDASLQPPASPNGMGVTPGPGAVTVQWNTKLTATSYNIYYLASAAITSAELQATGLKVTVAAAADPQPATQSQQISGLLPGTQYNFIVTAENAAGESAAQSSTKPATPTN